MTEPLCVECGAPDDHPFHRDPNYVQAHQFLAAPVSEAAPTPECQCGSCSATRRYGYSMSCCPRRLTHGSLCVHGVRVEAAVPTTPLAPAGEPTAANFVRVLAKCPVCDGAGTVSRPPWVAGDAQTWTDSATRAYPCKACDAKGWIDPPQPDTTVTVYSTADAEIAELRARVASLTEQMAAYRSAALVGLNAMTLTQDVGPIDLPTHIENVREKMAYAAWLATEAST